MSGIARESLREISDAGSTELVNLTLAAAVRLYRDGYVSGRDLALVRSHAKRRLKQLAPSSVKESRCCVNPHPCTSARGAS